MRYALLGVLLLAGCSNVPPPPPLPPIARVDFKPLTTRIQNVKDSGTKVDTQLEATRDRLDAAIVDAHQQKEANASLDANLQSAKASLTEAIAERKRQADEIIFLNIDKNATQEEADTAVQKGNAAVLERNEFAQDAANYKALKAEVDAHWGLGAYWYGTKRLGWHIIIVLVILAGISFLLNMFVPALGPVFAVAVKFFVGIPGRVVAFLKHLWPRKPPP